MAEAKKLRGRAWIFGDILNVDWEILPYDIIVQLRAKGIPTTEDQLGKYCMTNVDPDFPKKVKKGDFIVAGENFGYGQDHFHVFNALRGAGVAAIICESSNTNFVRNAIHNGLPPIVYKGIKSKVKEGDELEIDLKAATIVNLTSGETIHFEPFPDFLLEIMEAGGLHPLLKKRIAEGKVP